jgi:hypothetical protein
MQESLKLFDSICNNKWFGDTSIILFLNKKAGGGTPPRNSHPFRVNPTPSPHNVSWNRTFSTIIFAAALQLSTIYFSTTVHAVFAPCQNYMQLKIVSSTEPCN